VLYGVSTVFYNRAACVLVTCHSILIFELFVLNSTWHEQIVAIRGEPCAVAISPSVTWNVIERTKADSYCSLSRQSSKREAPKCILFVYEIKHRAAMRILIGWDLCYYVRWQNENITGVVCVFCPILETTLIQ
jgi:hypothetical protein